LEGIGRLLRLETPERKDELLALIRTRAEELEEADRDLPVDGPSQGMLALTTTVLAAYEALLPVFDEDQRRTILFLQHVLGAAAVGDRLRAPRQAWGRRGRDRGVVPPGGPLLRLLLQHRVRPARRRSLRDAGRALLLPGLLRPPRQPAAHHRRVRLGRQLDAGGGPGGQRAARRAHLADVAGGRRLPVPGGAHRRSAGLLHRRAGPAVQRRSGSRLTCGRNRARYRPAGYRIGGVAWGGRSCSWWTRTPPCWRRWRATLAAGSGPITKLWPSAHRRRRWRPWASWAHGR